MESCAMCVLKQIREEIRGKYKWTKNENTFMEDQNINSVTRSFSGYIKSNINQALDQFKLN